MAITQDELNSIISSVLSSIRTNSKTIEQMTPATSLGETDYFEVSGGKKVSYSVLKELIGSMLTDDIDSLRTQIEQAKTLAQTAKTTAETMQTSKEDVANKVTTLDADATDEQYPSAKAVKDTIDGVDTRSKIKYLGVTVNEGVNKLIPELYLTGLDESKTYEIYSITKGNTSRDVLIYDTNWDDVDIHVATAYTNDLTTDVLRVEEANGSGISGWIVCNWEAVPDGKTNYFAKVRTEAVVNLSNSPRIALTLEIERNKAKLDEAIAETEAKADYIGNRLDRLETGKYYQEISLDSIGIRREGYYINKQSGKQLTASVGVISNAIFLNPGDSIVAFTGGTGMAVIARSETEPDDSTVYIPEAIADNLTEPVNYIVEVAGYYSFCGRNATEGELALSVNVKKHTETEGIIPAMQEAIDGLYGPITEVVYSLSDLRGDGELVDYYLNNAQLRILAATDAIVTKPIYLHAGDKVECSTGGTGLLLFAKSPSGIIDRTTLGFVSISGTATSYSGVISEDAWYVFSGRINRTDGTNLVVKINAYTKEKSVFELLNEKVSKSDLSFSLEDVAEQSSGYALTIGADSVKDVIPTDPWFGTVDNDGTTYGTYLDDKIDSIPQGDSFIFISDVHYAGNKKNSGKLIDYVRRRLGIKTIIHGGDVLNESPTIAQAAKEWLDFNRDFVFRIGGDFKQVCGDHDHNGRYASEGQALSYQFIQRVINGYNIKELKFDTLYDKQVEEIATSNGWTDNERKEYDAWKKMHYYFDDTTIRTRFVILHTGWTGEAGLAVDKLGTGVVSETNALYLQMDFLYESLITCPANYNVVVVGHNVIGNKSYTIDSGEGTTAARYNVNEIVWKGAWLQVAKMVDAFKGKNSIVLSYRDWSGQGLLSKQFDFSIAKTPGIVFCMGGDVHWDILGKFSPNSNTLSPVTEATLADIIPTEGYVSKSDILHALTMTDGGDRGYKVIVAAPDDNYDDAIDSTLASASNTAGTLDSQAFDVVTITGKAIYFTRIGSGKDRVVYISD